jgi:chromosome partitioning protein
MDISELKLVGLAEVATLFGVTKQVVANWRKRKPTFPEPLAELRSGPVWLTSVIMAWARTEGVIRRTKGGSAARRA